MPVKYFVDLDGFRHEAEFDDEGKIIADKRFDKNNQLVGEGIYKNGGYVGRKEYFTDSKGYRHETEFDEKDVPVADKRFDKNNQLVGEGIYKNGGYAGRKEYFTDSKGYRHEAVFDEKDMPVADKRFDEKGNVVGKGVYKKVGKRSSFSARPILKQTDDKAVNKESKDKPKPLRILDEQRLPKLTLAPGLGKDTYELDLKDYEKELSNLKPGEELAIGRDPKSKNGIKIPEEFNYVSRQHCSVKRMENGRLALFDTSTNGTGVMPPKEAIIDKDHLPKLMLAPGLGKDTYELDLKDYEKELSNLKPGEELAIGRDPKSKNGIKIPEEFNYVSRQHCSIRKLEDGRLALFDTSTNGTDIIRPKDSRQKDRDDRPPSAPPAARTNGNVPPSAEARGMADLPVSQHVGENEGQPQKRSLHSLLLAQSKRVNNVSISKSVSQRGGQSSKMQKFVQQKALQKRLNLRG